MSKSTDVTLNIRARNLAGKTLDEINAQVEQLAKNNDAQATSADKAARSMRDLNDTSKQLATAYRELTRREGITKSFVEQQAEIKSTSQRLAELTTKYRELNKGGLTKASLVGLQDLGREIIEVNDSLNRLVRDNAKSGKGLGKIGVDAASAVDDLARLQQAVARTGGAYKASEAEVAGYANAQRRAGEVATEAARRQADAAKLQAQGLERIKAIGSRNSELNSLRADIQARSEAARVAGVQAEAERRLATEQAKGAQAQALATARINEAVAASNRRAVIRAQIVAGARDEAAAEAKTTAALTRSQAIRRQLITLLTSAIGQRGRSATAVRGEATAIDKNTAAKTRNAAATRQAGTNLALFSDVGRKSLGTYQRLRGQLLGLTAAYVGFYQVINTAQKAIAATNKNTSLQVGLRTINNGDAQAAADDYAFLRKEADRLGLVFDDLAPQYANVAISGKALGLNTKQLRDLFTDTATAAAGLNLTAEDSEGVFRALTQIMSKGKLQAEELRGQLGDRLPGAVVKFAQASNISLTDLDKRLQEGSLGVDVLIKGIKAYSDQFDGELDTITNRLQAYINRATNAYNDFLRTLLTGANDAKLKTAFSRIEEFFKGREGQQFADALATAFGKAIDVFIALAQNVDLVVLAVKAFLGLQALKAVNDLVIGVAKLGTVFVGAKNFIVAYNAATVAAAAGTGRLTLAMRALQLLLGPVGIALAVVSLAAYKSGKAFDDADQSADDFISTLKRLTAARGADSAAAGIAAVAEVQAKNDQVQAIEKRIQALNKQGKGEGTVIDSLQRAQDLTVGTRDSVVSLREQQKQYTQEVLAGAAAVQLLSKRNDAYQKLQAQPDAPLPSLGGTGKKDKAGSGGVSDKSQAGEENARLNAARAIAKQLLDLDQQIFDARTAGEVRTSEQVAQNYAIRIQQIESEIEEAYLKVDQLEQAAKRAGATYDKKGKLTGGGISAEDAAGLQAAKDRLEQLRYALNAKALEKSETQDIQILETNINDLISQRASKVEYINALKDAGLINEVDAYNQINATQDGYNQRIAALVQTILPLLNAISPEDPRYAWAQKLIADMDVLLVRQRQYTVQQKVILNLGAQFAQGAASALVTLGKGFAGAITGANSLGDAFKGAMDAFREFAADFLQQIAQMIIQAIILKAIQNAINGTSGGYGAAIAGALGGTNHTGGLVGGTGQGPKRRVNPAVFAGAQRFHTGGLPGLRTGEVATILKKGEEVLPEDNPRHVANQGAQQEGVTQVIATFDPADVVIRALGDTRVRKRMFAFFGANSNAINKTIRR